MQFKDDNLMHRYKERKKTPLQKSYLVKHQECTIAGSTIYTAVHVVGMAIRLMANYDNIIISVIIAAARPILPIKNMNK